MLRLLVAFAAPFLLADAPGALAQSVDFSSGELSLADELQQAINSQRQLLGQPPLQPLTNELEEASLFIAMQFLESS